MKRTTLRTLTAFTLATLCGTGAWAQAKLDKVTLAGWSKPITEITNLLVRAASSWPT